MSSDVREFAKKEIAYHFLNSDLRKELAMTSQRAAAATPAQVRTQEALDDDDVNDDDDVTGSEDDNCWSQEDDQITAQYQTIRKIKDRDTISQMSIESSDSSNQQPIFFQVNIILIFLLTQLLTF